MFTTKRCQPIEEDRDEKECTWIECGRVFKSIAGRKQHERMMHKTDRKESWVCTKCKGIFPNLATLNNHMKTCQTAPRGTCPYCGETKSISNIAKHKRTCAQYNNLIDGYTARDQNTVDNNNDNNDKYTICVDCGKEMLKKNLSRHQKVSCPGPAG